MTEDGTVCQARHEPSPELVHRCVLLAACTPPWLQYGGSSVQQYENGLALSVCIALDLFTSAGPDECMDKATTCEEVSRCLGSGYYEGNCPLEPESGFFCDGTRMVDCVSLWPAQYFDCGTLGARCVELEADGSRTVDCAVDAPCGETDDAQFRCDGDKRVQCRGGVAHGEDCAAQEMTCREGPDGAECVDPPAKADECVPSPPRCEPDGSISFCDDDGTPAHIDCPAVGLTCLLTPESNLGFECRAPDCNDDAKARCVEDCAGSVARICVGGSRVSVDCRQHGFDYCLQLVGETGPLAQCAIPVQGGFLTQ